MALASGNDRVYMLLVKEDAILEWGQVAAYGLAVGISAATLRGLWRRGDTSAVIVLGGLTLVSLLAMGEELSWGQRIVGFETPDIASANRQGELTLHNDARVEEPARLALLIGAVYGMAAPLAVRRRTPFAPSRALVGFFAVVVAYMACRLLLLDHPSYAEAKYSEWPETCFAVALALWCADVGGRARPSRGHGGASAPTTR